MEHRGPRSSSMPPCRNCNGTRDACDLTPGVRQARPANHHAGPAAQGSSVGRVGGNVGCGQTRKCRGVLSSASRSSVGSWDHSSRAATWGCLFMACTLCGIGFKRDQRENKKHAAMFWGDGFLFLRHTFSGQFQTTTTKVGWVRIPGTTRTVALTSKT